MTFRPAFVLLLALVLLATAARAQTPLGQPSLDESKVQMWCATVRFVYDDAGRPNLKSTVRCEGGNLDALAASIRPDSLRVYSLLYQPIEGRGAIYQGKKDNPARLAALAKAIVSKLKSSPARRKDPARMARVAALETALTNYVTSGMPMGEVAAAMAPEKADTAVAATAPGAPGPAEAAEAQAAAERDAAANNSNAGSAATSTTLLDRFAAPLALILGILSLVLYIMLRITLGHWRRQQRRETLEAKQAAATAAAAAAETSAAVADSAARLKRAEALVLAAAEPRAEAVATPALDRLSAAQRLEVERLVSQRVDEELRWLRANLPELVAEATGTAATSAAVPAPLPGAPATSQVADDVQMD